MGRGRGCGTGAGMTTIAWDGAALAADRLCNSGDVAVSIRKLHDCGAFAYAGCGAAVDVVIVADWLRDGAPDVQLTGVESSKCCGIAVRKHDRALFTVEIAEKRPILLPIEERFHAEGSGRQAALAAMACGKSAREAVKIAARFDVCTGRGVDSVIVRPDRCRSKGRKA